MNATEVETEINAFMSCHQMNSVDRQFVQQGSNSFWAVYVELILDEWKFYKANKDLVLAVLVPITRPDNEKVIFINSAIYAKALSDRTKVKSRCHHNKDLKAVRLTFRIVGSSKHLALVSRP